MEDISFKDKIKDCLLNIKKIVLNELPRLEELAGAQSNETELTFFNEMGVLNQKGNAIRILFQPMKLENDNFIKFGIMNNYIKLFQIDSDRPIIFPFIPGHISANSKRDEAEEEMIFSIIASKCTTEETFKQFEDLHKKIFYGINNEMLEFKDKPLNN